MKTYLFQSSIKWGPQQIEIKSVSLCYAQSEARRKFGHDKFTWEGVVK